MITFEQALTANHFHENHAEVQPPDGPRGGKNYVKIYEHRRNGATQTWKTRPGEFRIPVKYGLRGYGQITNNNAGEFHVAEECPLK